MSEGKERSTIGFHVSVPRDVVRSANEFLQRIVGPVADAADLLSDKLRFIRFRSAIKTLCRAKEIADQAGVELNQVAVKFLVPFLETASVEDENSELIDRWAALLVSAAEDTSRNLNWCIRILAELNGRQARLLDAIKASSPSIWHSDNYTPRQASDTFDQELQVLGQLSLDEVGDLLRRYDGYCFILCEDDIPNTNELHLDGFDDGQDLLQCEALGLTWVFASWVLIANKRHFYIRAFLTPLGSTFIEACSKRE